jgi:mannosyltransferase OCH1-like enzyme
MIPKILWQTYKTPQETLPEQARRLIGKWKEVNPEYEYRYMDDADARKFIEKEYGLKWVTIWDSYPLGIMRGDIWRYLIINKYGGVYADLDTVCQKPIDTWVDNEISICIDDDQINYAQSVFASTSKNPILLKVLELIEASAQSPNYSTLDFVHNMTGVHIWTKAVNEVVNQGYSGMTLYTNNYDDVLFNGAVKHLGPAKSWKGGYVMWLKELQKNDYSNYRPTR